jgi:hypothetical protein
MLDNAAETINFSLRERQRRNLASFKLILKQMKQLHRYNYHLTLYLIDRFIIKVRLVFAENTEVNSERDADVFSVYLHENGRQITRLIRFLKRHLKLAQNLTSRSEANKWAECIDLVSAYGNEMEASHGWKSIDFIFN